jgi:C4-dicarboxylate transporter/malic acid transport protein
MRISTLGPNWYASVMGTGIVANAAALLPVHMPALHAFAIAVWILAAVLLAGLLAASATKWTLHRSAALAHFEDPAMAQFYGAPPMALLTVGAGALLVGRSVIGVHDALEADIVLWSLGTVAGLAASAAIPFLMFTRHRLEQQMTLATWLMPVVPPMVSAATGAALVPHLAAGQLRLTLLLACYSMFGLSLIASLIVISLVWARLAYHGPGPAQSVPTFWIVLGPLGQSITAANLLGVQAPHAIAAPYSTALRALGVVYGAPVWGFAILWLVIAAAITIRAASDHLPFTLTWWSFTFPVGTVVTGTSELALHTGADLFKGAAIAFYALLLGTWLTAAVYTTRGSLNGRLFAPARAIARSSAPGPAVPGASA